MWRHPAAKPLLALLLAWPACWLLWAAFHDQLGPNPAEALIRQSGDWALRALCMALAVTPLRVITGQVLLMRFRRMLGVNVFVMGDDWAGKFDFMESACHVVYLTRTEGVSTTQIKASVLSTPSQPLIQASHHFI